MMVGGFIRGRREAMRSQGSNRPIVIIPTHPKLTKVPWLSQDALDVLDRPQGIHPESFSLISLVLAEIYAIQG